MKKNIIKMIQVHIITQIRESNPKHEIEKASRLTIFEPNLF